MRYRCLKAQDADEQNQNPHRKPSAMNASADRVGVDRFNSAWLPDRQGSTIDVVCDHIPERGGHRVKAVGTMHEADLALLFVTDRVRHDAEPRIALPTPGLIGHLDCAGVMDAH
jgi:hypothetical protein